MVNKPAFIKQQYAFAAHIRNPDIHPAPDNIEDRRMAIYRDLFYNNVEGFLSSTFPVLRGIYDDSAWHAMARQFFSRHQCHTPYFLEIPREFINYLEHEHETQDSDPPFLLELAHYEWVELALSVAENNNDLAINADAELMDKHPIISSVAWPFSYQYAVHTISPDNQPEKPDEQPTYLLLYRDVQDEVKFLELNPVSARLLTLLQEDGSLTGRGMLAQIAEEIQHALPDVVISGGHDILKEWLKRGIVLDSR
ncbi:MAG: putative DNA-binding domain-containing protein [Gammaproteobacteria bacterium]